MSVRGRLILGALALLGLVGCEPSVADGEHELALRQRQHLADTSAVHVIERDTADMGSAAEARMWELSDGSCWVVIGRPEAFVVYRKVGDDWQVSAATRTMVEATGLKRPAAPAPAYSAGLPATPAEAKP